MAKRTKARHGDRIVNQTTGETGTIIDVHSEVKPKGSPDNYTVLRDTGTRSCVVWHGWEVDVRIGAAHKCHRCGAPDHNAISCPNGDMP